MRLSALLLLSTTLVDARELDDSTLATINADKDHLAWAMLIPHNCQSEVCNVFGKFWNDISSKYPGITWTVQCGPTFALNDADMRGACNHLMTTDPTVILVRVHGSVAGNQFPSTWQPYLGKKDGPSLLAAVEGSIRANQAAGGKFGNARVPPIRPYPDPATFESCLESAYRTAIREGVQSSSSSSASDASAADEQSTEEQEEEEEILLPGWDDGFEMEVDLDDLEKQQQEEEEQEEEEDPQMAGGACQDGEGMNDDGVCEMIDDTMKPLRPSAVSDPPTFSNFSFDGHVGPLTDDGTPAEAQEEKDAMVTGPPMQSGEITFGKKRAQHTSKFHVVRQAVQPDEVDEVRRLLREYEGRFDADPDSVDGMPTHELFLRSPELSAELTKLANPNTPRPQGGPAAPLKGDADPVVLRERMSLRAKLEKVLGPVIDQRISKYLQSVYGDLCGKDRPRNRACTPCYVLVRRYLAGERRTHELHYDGHSFITAVISLSDHGKDNTGGYVVSTPDGRQHIEMNRGDLILHTSDLYHGVDVRSGERWSIVMWYRDSMSCADHGHKWYEACAKDGDAVCQGLHATKVTSLPGMTQDAAAQTMLEWNLRAARGGFAPSILKIARANLKRLPSTLPYNPEEAARFFRKGIKATNDPECYFGLAQMLLDNQTEPTDGRSKTTSSSGGGSSGGGSSGGDSDDDGVDELRRDARVSAAVTAFEQAALRHHAFAAFNLGVAHLHGHGHLQPDAELATEWFKASRLPEGLLAAAVHMQLLGRWEEAEQWREWAANRGIFQPWRRMSLERTGTGGASGVSLHSSWPGGLDC